MKESLQPRGHKRAGGGAGAWGRSAQACMLARWRVSAWKENGHGSTEREEGGGRKECVHAVVAGDSGACAGCRQPDCLNPFTGMIAARPGRSALTKLRRQFGKAEGWREREGEDAAQRREREREGSEAWQNGRAHAATRA
jgi:hypothetical protein